MLMLEKQSRVEFQLLMKAVLLLFCFVSVVGLAADVRVGREQERPATLTSAEPPARTKRPLIGAIRWDGWGNNCGIGKDTERVLGPAKYQHRAPFFVAAAGPDFIRFKPLSQEIMDTEIRYAIHAGIDYWAFDWYPPGNGMELARNQFLASKKRERLKWCVVLGTNPFDMNRDASWLAAEFAKPGYQKVLDGRPLVYLFAPMPRTDLAVLRELSLKSCGKSPYVAMMGWTAKETAQASEAVGTEAITMYAGGMEKNWDEYAKLKELVPNVSTGWDPAPFRETHAAWYPPENIAKDFHGWLATPKQLVTSMEAAFVWMRANPGKVPANTLLLYAWNEHAEGGWLCPTYSPQGPNTERIDALHEWLSRQGSGPD
jgi:hypothetical protein